MADEHEPFSVMVDGQYGTNDGAIRLLDMNGQEIVMWDSAEWIEDPSVVYVIASAILYGYKKGALALREMIGSPAPTKEEENG